jgi:hypothetical protein
MCSRRLVAFIALCMLRNFELITLYKGTRLNMSTFKSKANFRMSAGRAAFAFCLVVGLLCLSKFVYALEPASSQQEVASHTLTIEKQRASKPVSTVPTVATVPTVPPTPTPTLTPTATPTKSGVDVNVDTNTSTNGRKLSYNVNFNNTTGSTIPGAKTFFTVPNYTNFSFPDSQAGWQCPNGTTAGNQCQYTWGDIPPNAAEVSAASGNASRQTTFTLDVLVDQVPANVKSISFDIFVADSTGKIYATYHATSPLSSTPTYERFLPLIKQQ